jgi:hypothetical protein
LMKKKMLYLLLIFAGVLLLVLSMVGFQYE